MKKIQFAPFVMALLLATACINNTDKKNGEMDSIGNPTPNPTHTDTLRSIRDTMNLDSARRDTIRH